MYLQSNKALFLCWVRGRQQLLHYIFSAIGCSLFCTIFYTRPAWHHRELFTSAQWHSNHHQPEVKTTNLLTVTSRTLGPLAPSVIVSHFLGGGDSSAPICLSLYTWHFKEFHALGVHEPVGYAEMLKHFRAGFSVHIQFWCLGTGTHAVAQGQKAPLPVRKGTELTLMPSKGLP